MKSSNNLNLYETMLKRKIFGKFAMLDKADTVVLVLFSTYDTSPSIYQTKSILA